MLWLASYDPKHLPQSERLPERLHRISPEDGTNPSGRSSHTSQAGSKVVIDFILTELLLKSPQLRFGTDHHRLHASDFCAIFHVLFRHTIAVARVMSAACVNPRRAGYLEIGPALPHGTCDWQLRQWLQRFHRVHFVDDEAKAIAKIYYRGVNCRSGWGVKNQTYRIFLATDAERVTFK